MASTETFAFRHYGCANQSSHEALSFMALRSRCCIYLLAVLLSLSASAQDGSPVITLRPTDQGHVFDGLGAVSAGASSRLLIDYPEKQRNEILDYLFKPGYGASLQHLKVEIGADVNSTDGSEPSHMRSATDHDYNRGYEWWLMKEAKKRNPKIILDALPWGAPGWIGEGHLYSQQMADYVVDFLLAAKRVHGLDIDYVGIWNERMYDGEYVKALAASIRKAGLKTRIVCCDSTPYTTHGMWGILNGMKQDPGLARAIDAVGVHYPWEKHEATPADAWSYGKPLWSSEDQPNPGGGPFVGRAWNEGGRILAKRYNVNYLDLHLTKTEIWSPITSYYENLAAPHSGLMYANTPWSGTYEVQSTIWVTAHTTQFAQPGWQYMDNASGKLSAGGSYVSLRSPSKTQWSTVVETVDAKQSQTIEFSLEGSLGTQMVHVWQTDASHSLEKVADIAVHDGRFRYTFAPNALYTVTNTTGQGRGEAQPPAPAAFPFPYSDNFDQIAEGHTPKFLSDQDGAFEAHACRGRKGRCLEQMIVQKPTPWAPLPNPFTMTGDDARKDYTLSADVNIPAFGAATVMGRIESADVFQDRSAPYPAGYVLQLHADGNWELLSTAFKKSAKQLASGTEAPLANTWHHVQLVFHGNEITAMVDGKQLAKVVDTQHTHGMFAVGSDWSRVQFDNLSVEAQ